MNLELPFKSICPNWGSPFKARSLSPVKVPTSAHNSPVFPPLNTQNKENYNTPRLPKPRRSKKNPFSPSKSRKPSLSPSIVFVNKRPVACNLFLDIPYKPANKQFSNITNLN